MSINTYTVEIEAGRLVFATPQPLPDKATGLLIVFPHSESPPDPLQGDPALRQVQFFEEPTQPLDPKDWPEAFA